jgi:hypothetical protein
MNSGYCVIDNFVQDESVAKKMREEMCSMPIRYENEEEEEKEEKMPCMRPNRTHFTDAKNNAKRYLFSKPGVFEYDMHMNTATNSSNNINGSINGGGSMATLDRFFEATGKQLAEAFNKAVKEEAFSAIDDDEEGEEEEDKGKQQKHRSYARVIKVKPGDENRTVKLQINTCGAFPYHFDNPGGARQNRKLTCILYLNEAYEDKCGGEIVLVPFMGPFVTIRPIFNRLVVFQSETVLHRVNKAVNFPGKGRACLTVWLDGDDSDDDDEKKRNASVGNKNIRNDLVQLFSSPSKDLISYIRQTPDAQRFLSRWAYRDEYEISLLESHEPGKGLEHMLEAHEDAIKRMRKIQDGDLQSVLERVREMRREEEMEIVRL